MSRTDDLDRQRDEMRKALKKIKAERNDGIIYNELSRVESIAHAKWSTKMKLEGKDVNKPNDEERKMFFDILENVKREFLILW